MTLKQMEYFIAVIEEGNVSAAAKKLHIAQPPLSQQMKLLEQELGVVLFERGARNVVLTEAGGFFLERARNILELTDNTVKEIEAYAVGNSGILRIGMISSAETADIITQLTAFKSKNIKSTFNIFEGNTYQVLDWLEGGVIELAIIRTPFPTEQYELMYLSREKMMAVGKHEYFEGMDHEVGLEHLQKKPLIIYRRWKKLLDSIWNHIDKEYVCVNDDARTSLLWAQCGAGIAIVPYSCITQARKSGLEVRRIVDEGLDTDIVLAKKKNASLSRVGKRFWAFFEMQYSVQ